MLKWTVPLCIAGALAVLLWPKPEPYEADYFVPIAISALPMGLALADTPPEGVEIRVRGPENVVRRLPDRPLVYPLDLSGLAAGVTTIPLRPERFGLPREAALLQVRPDALTLRIEREVTREVPVRVAVSGQPASGFQLEAARPIPPGALLRGPESRIEPVHEVRTRPIDISGARRSKKVEVALDLVEGVRAVTPGGVITAELTFAEVIEARVFPRLSLVGRHGAHPFTITPAHIDIEVRGPVNTLERLETEGIDAYVDLKGLGPGVYPRRAVISLPVETTLLGAAPEIFTVKIDPHTAPHAAGPPRPSR